MSKMLYLFLVYKISVVVGQYSLLLVQVLFGKQPTKTHALGFSLQLRFRLEAHFGAPQNSMRNPSCAFLFSKSLGNSKSGNLSPNIPNDPLSKGWKRQLLRKTLMDPNQILRKYLFTNPYHKPFYLKAQHVGGSVQMLYFDPFIDSKPESSRKWKKMNQALSDGSSNLQPPTKIRKTHWSRMPLKPTPLPSSNKTNLL